MSICVHVFMSACLQLSTSHRLVFLSVDLPCSWDATGQCDVKGGSFTSMVTNHTLNSRSKRGWCDKGGKLPFNNPETSPGLAQ